jgi:hypothetical protein
MIHPRVEIRMRMSMVSTALNMTAASERRLPLNEYFAAFLQAS